MGMPITIEIVDKASEDIVETVFAYFRQVDARYSPFKPDSEVSRINSGLPDAEWSSEMRSILELCELTKRQSGGYFDVFHEGRLDPSGLVKGWAIKNASKLVWDTGYRNYYVEAGGDVQAHGLNDKGKPWAVGIRNPQKINEIIKVVGLSDGGIATSGTYIRGQHIYNPVQGYGQINRVKSLTVIGPDIYEADRFATAAYAMGPKGIAFIEAMPELEGYMVDTNLRATLTSGFERYLA